MDIQKEFSEWAIAQGVMPSGIDIKSFPGSGLGIGAKKKFQAGDILLEVPTSCLRTFETVPKSISSPIGTITVQGLIAAELSVDPSGLGGPWRAVLPSKESFTESIPFMWHPSLQSLLPPKSLSLLQSQKEKISLDWAAVSAAFPDVSYDNYTYNWFLVSTRTFYYSSPKMKSKLKKPIKYDDCIALCPFADCFNHTDVGCEVTFSTSGYTISADREIEKGDELYISYGSHSNDFLLVEYGFILTENKWDELSLDEAILSLFTEDQRQALKEAGFLGKFVLDKETICYRTQVALRLLCMPLARWQRQVASGVEDKDQYTGVVEGILLKIFHAEISRADEMLRQVEGLDRGLDSQRQTLKARWKQIRLILAAALSRIKE